MHFRGIQILLNSYSYDLIWWIFKGENINYFSALIRYAINKRLHFDTHQKISLKLDVMLGLTKPYNLILV